MWHGALALDPLHIIPPHSKARLPRKGADLLKLTSIISFGGTREPWSSRPCNAPRRDEPLEKTIRAQRDSSCLKIARMQSWLAEGATGEAHDAGGAGKFGRGHLRAWVGSTECKGAREKRGAGGSASASDTWYQFLSPPLQGWKSFGGHLEPVQGREEERTGEN